MKKNSTQNQMRGRIIAAAVAIVIVVVALLLFMSANNQRITEQNRQYLEGSTQQTARRVDDMITNAYESVCTAARVYSDTLTSAQVDPIQAMNSVSSTQFDNTFFVLPNGIAYNGNDETADVHDRTYYQEGIQGKSGICAIGDSVFDEQNVMSFYSPVFYDGDVVGIMVCVYREEVLTSYMTTNFFGEQTTTYLCTRDGEVVAKSTVSPLDDVANVFALYDDNNLNSISLEQLEADFAEGNSVSFAYRLGSSIGSAYMMKLPSYEWMVLRTFPESITNGMMDRANFAGLMLVGGVVLAGAVVIVILMLQARRQKEQLLLERQEATRIIDASTNLFSRLLSIDLVDGTYEYLKSNGLGGNLSSRGTYDELKEYWRSTRVMKEAEGEAEVLDVLDQDTLQECLIPGVPYLQHEYLTQSGGKETWLQVSTLCTARDGDGNPTNLLVTVQDVTDVKAKELEAHQAMEDAFHAAEHASQAKSDFLNSMSHDIRTPMNSIMGLTAIASMHVDDPNRVRECLANITSASRHLLGLINEVLDMAKIESGSIGLSEDAFDLSETVENLITIVHPQVVAKNQELKVDLHKIEHENVIGDSTRLQQVFVNIMGNAVKFTPEGGTITLGISELPSRIPDYGCYEFVFADTGCGMSPEFLKTVFEPFTRANDSRTTKVEGTGLGMAIVKSVVSMMDGTIDVESEEGVGTTFTVTVHLKLRDGAEEDLSDLEGIRVLVIDDDMTACEGACALLEDIGMVSSYELSGQAGVDAVISAERAGEPYAAVILDWRMPGMSGIEAAKSIREGTIENVPIIILSGYDWSMIEQEAREVGVDAFISKPLFRSRLIQVMKELLSGEETAVIDEKALLEELAYTGKRVLLTEDNLMAAAIAEEIIGLTGAEVDHAENGKLAYEMVMEHEPGYYDIVLMDIQMPVMNGYEATSAIRAEAPRRPDMGELPIIALSADAFAEDVKHARAVGMNDHMAKPLEINALVRMLNKWMS